MKKINIPVEKLNVIAFKLFLGMGLNEKDATYAADVLLETDRRGVDTHGVARLSFYYWCVRSGSVATDAHLHVLKDDTPYLMVDAGNGLGITMAPQAVDLAIQKAKEHGICVMGVQNSNHFGAAGYYTAKCVEQGFISMVCSNSGPTMAPIGGKDKIHGNSPWSIAIPGGTRYPDPVMFDMACSEVARGKLETAEREGNPVPLGWGVDRYGEPCTDPTEILKNGSLLPFGGIKGYCITILVEALSSLLTFSSFGKGLNMSSGKMNTSHFVLLMDPRKFGDLSMYKNSIDEYVGSIKNSPLASGVEEIIVPGELEARKIQHRSKYGLDLDEAIVASLVEVGIKTGLLSEGQGFAEMMAWER